MLYHQSRHPSSLSNLTNKHQSPSFLTFYLQKQTSITVLPHFLTSDTNIIHHHHPHHNRTHPYNIFQDAQTTSSTAPCPSERSDTPNIIPKIGSVHPVNLRILRLRARESRRPLKRSSPPLSLKPTIPLRHRPQRIFPKPDQATSTFQRHQHPWYSRNVPGRLRRGRW